MQFVFGQRRDMYVLSIGKSEACHAPEARDLVLPERGLNQK